MILTRICLLGALLATGCQATYSVSIPKVAKNVTLTGDSTSLKARTATSFSFPAPISLFVNGFGFVSGEVSATTTKTGASVNGSLVVGISLSRGSLLGFISFPPVVAIVSITGSLSATTSSIDNLFTSIVGSFTGLFSGLVSGSASGSAMIQVYHSIIEFNDANSNNVIDDSETIVQTILLEDLDFSTVNSNSSNEIVYETMTSDDDLVTLQTQYSKVNNVLSSTGKILTPRSISTDVYINSFPYKGNKTKLALRTYIAGISAKFGSSSTYKLSSPSKSSLSTSSSNDISNTFSSWVATAKTQSSKITYTASIDVSGSDTEVITTVKSSNTSDIQAVLDIASIIGGSIKADLYTVDYVFNAIQPAAVFFDPTVGAGSPITTNTNANDGNRVTLNLASFSAGILATGFVLWL